MTTNGTHTEARIHRGRPRVPRAVRILTASLTAGALMLAPSAAFAKKPPEPPEPTTTTTAPPTSDPGAPRESDAPTTTSTTAPALAQSTFEPSTQDPGATGIIDEKGTVGWLRQVAKTVGAEDLWKVGVTGEGVDVALIDTGVAPVPGVNRVVHGPDLSYEGQDPALRYLDGYGHGTHMAGIINGADPQLGPTPGVFEPSKSTPEQFVGIAPRARLVSVRVGNSDGTTDVSQVIAAINWVVENRRSAGLNIRVLNLAFGTDSVQPYQVDPLAYAVEKAWLAGIVVVAAAGNEGFGAPGLNLPASDPYVIGVGASDQNGTTSRDDDFVADFSNRGTPERRVDVVAPGTTTYSLRDPGSFLDEMYPAARVGDRMFRGSGTSEATAVVSGVVALVLQSHPDWSPDQVKAALRATAKSLPWAPGSPEVDENQRLVYASAAAKLKNLSGIDFQQRHARSSGLGSLEASRGSAHVENADSVLSGEVDVFGRPWNAQAWRDQTGSEKTWSNRGYWSDLDLTGPEWGADRWTGRSWRTGDWTGRSWRGDAWTGRSWRGDAWTGRSWRGDAWTGRSWRGDAWTGRSWRGEVWSGSELGEIAEVF